MLGLQTKSIMVCYGIFCSGQLGFFIIPTTIFVQHRNPDGYCRYPVNTYNPVSGTANKANPGLSRKTYWGPSSQLTAVYVCQNSDSDTPKQTFISTQNKNAAVSEMSSSAPLYADVRACCLHVKIYCKRLRLLS